ncbi:LysR family transcriptional regulator [Mameliella alba]|nr:LysR family transcriptional regulator [Mameliella alba]MBY6171785.1 LysR family transcriptional regulator [Mameliella alba]MBY6177010.1 LysR family transcriptional regulator [Mameliella alba]
MIYNDLALFTAVARHLSFSAAADQLGIPLSRVSRRIGALEDHLGIRLFERTTRQVRLTQEGRQLMDRCQEPIDSLQDIAGLAGDSTPQTIRLTAPPAAVHSRIGPRLLDFAARNPSVKLDLTATNAKLDFFRDNIDLAFRVGPLQDSGLMARKLWTLTYAFCAGAAFCRDHDLSTPATVAHLLTLPALVSRQPWHIKGGETLKPKVIAHQIDTLALLAEAARRNMGVTILPREMVTDGLQEITVRDACPVSRDMFAVYPSGRLLPARVRNLIDFMAAG